MTQLSIIIPTLNEAQILETTLRLLLHSPDTEIIIVDGGSEDQTLAIATGLGVKVVQSPQLGRAFQMNFGAKMAQGEILLFLHADSKVPQGYAQFIKTILSKPQTVAGAFSLKIEGSQLALRLIEKMVNWRSQFFSLPYGDQGLFIKTELFQEMGGFAELPIMEDFEMIKRLQKRGKIAIIPNPVITSARRWQKLGIWKTTLLNQLIILGYYARISPHTLAKWYGKRS